MADNKNIERYVPRTGRLLTENGEYVNEADFVKSSIESFTPFNETRTVERTVVFSLASIYPLSMFRDIVTGTVTQVTDEYVIAPSSSLESAERGVYVPGYNANAGLGIRVDTDAEAEWGYFDDNNGFFFRKTAANGLEIVIRRRGTDIVIPRETWSEDKLDGEGPSGINLDLSEGYVFEVNFTWYGYGAVVFSILDKGSSPSAKPKVHSIHILSTAVDTSTSNPNLPIRASNIGTTGDVHVTGRQYSVVGKYQPESRITGITSNIVNVDTSWTPVISFRAQVPDLYKIYTESISIENEGVVPVEYQLLLKTTPNSEVAIEPDNRSAIETAVEFNIDSTSFTNGEMFYSGLVGAGKNNDSTTLKAELDKPIPRDYWVTLACRALSGTADVTSHLRVREDW